MAREDTKCEQCKVSIFYSDGEHSHAAGAKGEKTICCTCYKQEHGDCRAMKNAGLLGVKWQRV